MRPVRKKWGLLAHAIRVVPTVLPPEEIDAAGWRASPVTANSNTWSSVLSTRRSRPTTAEKPCVISPAYSTSAP